MTKRKSISKKTRFNIFKRDEFTCQYCGSTPPSVVLEVDHIVPVAEGGGNEDDNLVTSCFACNRGKGAKPLSSVPESLSNKAKRVKEAEEQLAEYHEILQAKKDRIESEAWDIAEVLQRGSKEDGFRINYLTSIKTFLKKLNYYEVEEAAEIVASRSRTTIITHNHFTYFCGICWSKIKENSPHD